MISRHSLLLAGVLLCAHAFEASGDTLRILYPLAGDTLYIGDTVTMRYTADSAYLTDGVGTVLSLSPDLGESWFTMCPLQSSEFAPVPVHDTSWGHPRIVIPDTLRDGELAIALPSDQMILRLHDYYDETICTYSSGPFAVTYKAGSVVTQDEPTDSDDDGCGAGVLCALLPPFVLRIVRRRRRAARHLT